ncbi:hypothetical protein L596_030443 [Steinernema carpocapsae]|uniref:Tc1-like transposase DDE domain-containing protein n=1 Tax=Steinernema carpocapsae TaxID=34508 RepID=A0A4U5LPG4_STECR|nr:hypothetical protein L596_030443 [Steinernema carpocapsae]
MASARLSKDCERPKKPFPKVHHGLGGSFGTKLHFFDQKKRFNAVGYQTKILEGVMKPWAEKNTSGIQWTYQQDGAPTHSANTTLNWLHDPTNVVSGACSGSSGTRTSGHRTRLTSTLWTSRFGQSWGKDLRKKIRNRQIPEARPAKSLEGISSELTIRIVDQFRNVFRPVSSGRRAF